jgi:hypothetical protein
MSKTAGIGNEDGVVAGLSFSSGMVHRPLEPLWLSAERPSVVLGCASAAEDVGRWPREKRHTVGDSLPVFSSFVERDGVGKRAAAAADGEAAGSSRDTANERRK